jgi:hypothetical protein
VLWSAEAGPSEDRAAQLRALRQERIRSTPRGPAEQVPQAAQPVLPLATLTPAPTEPASPSRPEASTEAATSSPIPGTALPPQMTPPSAPPSASPTAAPLSEPPTSAPPTSAPPAAAPLSEPPTAALPTPATVEFAAQRRPPAANPDLDFDDDFAGVTSRGRGQVRVLASPLAPPGQAPRRLFRYDLLAGAALLVALLALVPLLLLRGDPEEVSSAPQLPPAGGSTGSDVEIKLAEPVDLTDKVRLSWSASEELDFIVVVAAEGKETEYELAERNTSMTLPVELGLKYCFQVQATDGNDTYESNVVAMRNATCKK